MPETVVYKRVGECTLQLDIYYPVERSGLRPVVLWLHGGAFIFGDRTHGVQRSAIRQRSAQAGIATVAIDYRLAPETKLPQIVADAHDAFWWLQHEGPRFQLDTSRVALLGQSAGGYLALLLGAFSVPRPRAVVSLYGFGDISGSCFAEPDAYFTTLPPISSAEAARAVRATPPSGSALNPTALLDDPRFRFYVYTRQQGQWVQEVLGADPRTQAAMLDAYSARQAVSAGYPPTLLLHGTADTHVPYAESVAMAEALAAAQVPHQVVTIPEAGHVFDLAVTEEELAAAEPTSVARACNTAVDFLVKHLS